MTIGFALGTRKRPKRRKALVILKNGSYMGKLNPIHNIRMLGLDNCLTCCGIGDFHGSECAGNKKNFDRMMNKKKKLLAESGSRAAAAAAGEWQQAKKARRGQRGGGKRSEMVDKRSWADVAGASA